MIHREKDYNNPPLKLIHSKWDMLKESLLVEKHFHNVKPECYRDSTIEELSDLYKNKCAICERKRGTELQVDHYRPKKPRLNRENNKYNQPGYYWLAYCWSNLIPLCSKCNNIKSNKFPLMNWKEIKRIDSHENTKTISGFKPNNLDWLQKYELPLLINPEYEKEPEKHFSFKSDGKIVGRTEDGNETINLCGLNRKDLIRERLELRQKYIIAIKSAFDDFNKNRDASELKGELRSTFKKIKLQTDKDEEHSLYHTFIYKYFDYFISSKLPTNLREKTTKYFNDFKI